MDDLLTSPLHARHTALGATMGEFGGWSMPISYPDGTVAEHTAVRESVGLFDVSHLGKLAIAGPGAAAFVNRCFTADLDRIEPGSAQYTLCCTASGGVVDDVIVYLVGPDEVLAMPNAANAARVAELLRAAAPEGVTITDRHREIAVIAVQGPQAPSAVATVLPAAALDGMDYMAFTDSGDVRVCRTGYTGERGYELLVPAVEAPAVWDALVAAGAKPAGLAARDTLRTEMGYPLHGQDLSVDISPVQAGSGWAVGWAKPEFWGREALLAEKAAGPVRRLRGLRATGRGIPRSGMPVLRDGVPVGVTTSGTFSPTTKVGIALALIDTASGIGLDDAVTVDVRGRALDCVVAKPPFVPSHVR
ncbi:glycine cleavage system aminomethyltransferase GcvT [Pseudonocardia sp. GCM10023141]|uniref:glycine cleavage system aminomethyltransferase GcvT n=1 Tax=Pseudonocardia sp. GCM10023141 TaxID=3252653 RepID=UPI00361C5862